MINLSEEKSFSVSLKRDKGFSWQHGKSGHVKGDIIEKLPLDYEEEISNLCSSWEILEEKLLKLNGIFSVVFITESQIVAAVDKTRSIPLFYGIEDDVLYLSDDAYWVRDEVKDFEPDMLAVGEFYTTGYVTGGDTLYSKVKQLQAGEYLVFDRKTKDLEVKNYFVFRHNKPHEKAKKEMLKDLTSAHEQAAENMVARLKNRPVLLFLSGGHDSRLVAYMLKIKGYKNIKCATYGMSESDAEVTVAKQIADDFNLEWHFLPFDKKQFYDWYHTSERQDFYRYVDGLSSLPFSATLFAVQNAKKKGLIQEDTVILTGAGGDYLECCGIKIISDDQTFSKDDIVKFMLYKHHSRWPETEMFKKAKPGLLEKIGRLFKASGHNLEKDSFSGQQAMDIAEWWTWKERQSTWICNLMARTYEYCDCEWQFPLWDNALIDFWTRTSFKDKTNRELYLEYIKDIKILGASSSLDDNLRIKASKAMSRDLKEFIKKYTPIVYIYHKIEKIRCRLGGEIAFYFVGFKDFIDVFGFKGIYYYFFFDRGWLGFYTAAYVKELLGKTKG